jgi:His-Xaa-Ser system radical SAM maturase HxsB
VHQDAAVAPKSPPAFHRARRVAGKVVVTSVEGEWLLLEPAEYDAYRQGRVLPGSDLERRLREKNLSGPAFDPDRARRALARRSSFLGYGPNLHIFVVTLRCNETCVYCHASRASVEAVGSDMTLEHAERGVELALGTTSPSVTIEFQGGEPLLNFPVLMRIVEHAIERNRTLGKRLEFTLITNLAAMDEAKLEWLLEKRVQICTSVDGPPDLHDRQRKLAGGSAFERTAHWIRRINQRYDAMGLDPSVYRVEALLTTTRETLPRWKEVVDTYAELGCRAIFLRPVDPFGFGGRAAGRVGHDVADYLAFYRSAVEYMIARCLDGAQMVERFASIFLTKILRGDDPNYLDIRSPCGAGIGQIAYGYDGSVFTCDEGRMLHEDGDDTFLIGHVAESKYRDVVGHETVRALALASNLDAQPGCTTCAYRPYCGVCPVHNHRTQGSIFGRMSESRWCAVHMGIQDFLFELIARGDPRTLEILDRWTTSRPRTHFVQPPG